MRYVHTNLVARDWRRLASFYERAFGCVRAGPERDLRGDWLARGTGVPGAALRGAHLALPGGSGATLEIFEYDGVVAREPPGANAQGYGHIAFETDDVAAQVEAVVREGGSRLGEVVSREVDGAGVVTFAYVRDPEGNIVEVQSWRRAQAEGGAQLAGVDVQRGYDRWATGYDEMHNPTRDLAARVIRQWLARQQRRDDRTAHARGSTEDAGSLAGLDALAGQDALELGCGTGGVTRALVGARRVVGLDLSAGMLAHARARISAPQVWFARCDIRGALPLADASFDLAVISLVLEHVADVAPVMAELRRVLRPGGRAVIAELHPFRQLQGKQARFDDPDSGEAVTIAAHAHTTAELVGAALAAGLAVAGLGEWSDGGAGATPRVLTLELTR